MELPENYENLADFLTTEGVLLKLNRKQRLYHMSSPLLDGYIRTSILPARFSRTPLKPPEFEFQKNSKRYSHTQCLVGSYGITRILKDTIPLAASRSYKTSRVFMTLKSWVSSRTSSKRIMDSR